jgi:hypothetical protein
MREEVIELFDHFKGFSDAECVIVWQALTIGGDHRPRNPGGNLALHEGSREHWQGRPLAGWRTVHPFTESRSLGQIPKNPMKPTSICLTGAPVGRFANCSVSRPWFEVSQKKLSYVFKRFWSRWLTSWFLPACLPTPMM